MEMIILLSVGENCFCTSAPCVDNVSIFNLIWILGLLQVQPSHLHRTWFRGL